MGRDQTPALFVVLQQMYLYRHDFWTTVRGSCKQDPWSSASTLGQMSVMAAFIALPILNSWNDALLSFSNMSFSVNFLELPEAVLLFILTSSCSWASGDPEVPVSSPCVASSIDFPSQIQRAIRQLSTEWLFRYILWHKNAGLSHRA